MHGRRAAFTPAAPQAGDQFTGHPYDLLSPQKTAPCSGRFRVFDAGVYRMFRIVYSTDSANAQACFPFPAVWPPGMPMPHAHAETNAAAIARGTESTSVSRRIRPVTPPPVADLPKPVESYPCLPRPCLISSKIPRNTCTGKRKELHF
jgi:hypothetical protein